MSKTEKFKETLIDHYRAEIDTVILESEQVYRSVIDYEALDQKIEHLILCAKLDGVDEKEIWDILHYRIPSYVNFINYKKVAGKKAA